MLFDQTSASKTLDHELSHRFLTSYLTPKVSNDLELGLQLHLRNSPTRSLIESFILNRYVQCHSALIRTFPKALIELQIDHQRSACIGLRIAGEESLFLEQYLDKPIELLIPDAGFSTALRDQIVELGSFAALSVASGSILFTLLARSLWDAGFRWMTFTATAEIRKMIQRLGCEPLTLTEANPKKLVGTSTEWGSYYSRSPKVMLCDLEKLIAQSYSNLSIAKLFSEHEDLTSALVRAIKTRALSR